MNFNFGDVLLTEGKYRGVSVKEMYLAHPDLLQEYLTSYPNNEAHDAIDAIIKGCLCIDRPVMLPEQLITDATLFAEALAKTMGHIDNRDKLVEDLSDGRIGEWVIVHSLSDIYKGITEPDPNIYVTNKRWKPNLIDEATGQEFSVHSQSIASATHYKESWTFSTKDPQFKGLCDPKTKVCCVLVDQEQRIAKVRAIVNLGTLHEKKLFKYPMKPAFYKIKRCVYYSDLEEIDRCEL
jgi:hypothetical protein